jgi:hypothetical protein
MVKYPVERILLQRVSACAIGAIDETDQGGELDPICTAELNIAKFVWPSISVVPMSEALLKPLRLFTKAARCCFSISFICSALRCLQSSTFLRNQNCGAWRSNAGLIKYNGIACGQPAAQSHCPAFSF